MSGVCESGCKKKEMRAATVLILLVLASTGVWAGLSPAQIGTAKKQCQTNCAHIPAQGRGLVQHTRCVQKCWNDFFRSMMHPTQPKSNAIMHNVAHTAMAILKPQKKAHTAVVTAKRPRARGAPSSASNTFPLSLAILLGVIFLVL